MKVSVKIDEDVKSDLYKVAGEYQTKKGIPFSISDTIKELIKEHRKVT
jgi:hypothetical protein